MRNILIRRLQATLGLGQPRLAGLILLAAVAAVWSLGRADGLFSRSAEAGDTPHVVKHAAPAATPAQVGGAVMQRDAKAEQAVLESSHRLHHYFDTQNIDAIAGEIADDDFLFVYEMTHDGKPVKLHSKSELVHWLKTSFKEFEKLKAVTAAKNPVMHARATSSFAIVTEECSLKVIREDGTAQLQTLRATSVARRGPDGWKWIHWHMSPGAPRQMLDVEGKAIVPSASE